MSSDRDNTTVTESFASWLDQLPEEETQERIAALEKRQAAIAAELSYLREALALKERFRDLYRPQIERDAATATETAFVTRRPSSVRESVLLAMNASPEKVDWTVKEIHAALLERGWTDLSTQAMRTLAASLSRMTADGDLIRTGRGVYKVVAKPATRPNLLDQEDEAG